MAGLNLEIYKKSETNSTLSKGGNALVGFVEELALCLALILRKREKLRFGNSSYHFAFDIFHKNKCDSVFLRESNLKIISFDSVEVLQILYCLFDFFGCDLMFSLFLPLLLLGRRIPIGICLGRLSFSLPQRINAYNLGKSFYVHQLLFGEKK